ncbi:MAG: tetratricopeptide repeat protein [Sumerlaeia bacterium]
MKMKTYFSTTMILISNACQWYWFKRVVSLHCLIFIIPLGCSAPPQNDSTTTQDAPIEQIPVENEVYIERELSESIPARVQKILQRAAETTTPKSIQSAEGKVVVVLVPKIDNLDLGTTTEFTWNQLNDYYTPTPGEVVMEFGKETPLPIEALVSDSGVVFVLFNERLITLKPSNGIWETTATVEGPFKSIQWNHTAERLLVVTTTKIEEYGWQEWKRVRSKELSDRIGRIQYAPSSPDALWSMNSNIDLSADSTIRVRWNIEEFDWSTTRTASILEDEPFSDVGVFPPLKMAWALDSELGSIMPEQGVIQRLNHEQGSLGSVLTFAESTLDYSPSVDSMNNIYYLRASAYPNLVSVPHVFAWANALDSPTQSTQLTTEPTRLVSPSPSGKHVLSLVYRGGRWVLLYSEKEQLLQHQKNDNQTRLKVTEKINQVTEALKTKYNGLFKQTSILVSEDEFALDEAYFTALMNSAFGLQLNGELTDLSLLDDFFDFTHGFWNEEDELVYALGVYYGNLLNKKKLVAWAPLEVNSTLSYSLQEPSHIPTLGMKSAPLFYLGLQTKPAPFDFHSPFFIARERIAGNVSLQKSASDSYNYTPYPTLLVDEYSEENTTVLLTILSSTILEEGILESIQRYLKILEYRTYGLQEFDFDTAIKSSLEAAETFPMIAENLSSLASALMFTNFTTEAKSLANKSTELGANNPTVLLQASRVYLNLDDLDRAQTLQQQVVDWDTFNEFESELEFDAQLIEDLRVLNLESDAE